MAEMDWGRVADSLDKSAERKLNEADSPMVRGAPSTSGYHAKVEAAEVLASLAEALRQGMQAGKERSDG